jgi:hypothetical protein
LRFNAHLYLKSIDCQHKREGCHPPQTNIITSLCQKRHTYYPNMRPFDNKIVRSWFVSPEVLALLLAAAVAGTRTASFCGASDAIARGTG